MHIKNFNKLKKIFFLNLFSTLLLLFSNANTNTKQIVIFDKVQNECKKFIANNNQEEIITKINRLNKNITKNSNTLEKIKIKNKQLKIILEKLKIKILTKINKNEFVSLKLLNNYQKKIDEQRELQKKKSKLKEILVKYTNKLEKYHPKIEKLMLINSKFYLLTPAFNLHKISIDDSSINEKTETSSRDLLLKILNSTTNTNFSRLALLFNTKENIQEKNSNFIKEITKQENTNLLNEIKKIFKETIELEEKLLEFINNINEDPNYNLNLLNIKSSNYRYTLKRILLSAIGAFGIKKTFEFIPQFKKFIIETNSFISSNIISFDTIYDIIETKQIIPLLITRSYTSKMLFNYLPNITGIPFILASTVLPFGTNILYNFLYEFSVLRKVKKQQDELKNKIIYACTLINNFLKNIETIKNTLQNNENFRELTENITSLLNYKNLQTNFGLLLNILENTTIEELNRNNEKLNNILKTIKKSFSYFIEPNKTGINILTKALSDLGRIDIVLSIIEEQENQLLII